jgi:hypothetical protein
MHDPIGPADPKTIGAGKNVRAPGAAPNGHMVIAPQQTPNPIIQFPFLRLNLRLHRRFL